MNRVLDLGGLFGTALRASTQPDSWLMTGEVISASRSLQGSSVKGDRDKYHHSHSGGVENGLIPNYFSGRVVRDPPNLNL